MSNQELPPLSPEERRAIADRAIDTPPSPDEGVRIHAARLAGLTALPDRSVPVRTIGENPSEYTQRISDGGEI